MAFNKITDQDVAGLGVSDLPDVPGLTAADLKAQFDEYSRYLKNRFNQLIDELAEKSAAKFIGSEDGNVQADINTLKEQIALKAESVALNALAELVKQKANAADVVAKDSTEAYVPTTPYSPATKKYVDDTLVAVGAGDMATSVYDPQNKKSDIFAAIDGKVSKAGDTMTGNLRFRNAYQGPYFVTGDVKYWLAYSSTNNRLMLAVESADGTTNTKAITVNTDGTLTLGGGTFTGAVAFNGGVSGITKADVGLGKVNNNTISMSLSGTTLTISYS